MAYEQLKLDSQMCFRFYTVARLIMQEYQPFLSQLGITYTQYLVLMVLWEQDHQPVNNIAKRLLLETNTVTPLIKRMEAQGIVTREKGEADGRQIIVNLTDKGKNLEAEAVQVPNCMVTQLTEEGLSVEQMAQLAAPLDEIIKKMSRKKVINHNYEFNSIEC